MTRTRNEVPRISKVSIGKPQLNGVAGCRCVISIQSIQQKLTDQRVSLFQKARRARPGKPTASATRAKIRNVMSAVFSHAIRYGWIPYNPIKAVRTSTQRLRDPDLLSPKELPALLRELQPRERTMVLLDASTGLRRGELMALRWGDIDFETLIARVTRSIYRNVIGKPKTAASKKPVPLHPIVAAELKLWRSESVYRADSDFLFPSDRKKGNCPSDQI